MADNPVGPQRKVSESAHKQVMNGVYATAVVVTRRIQ